MDDEIHILKQAMNLEDKNSSKLDDDDNISFLDKLIGIAEIFPSKKPKKGYFSIHLYHTCLFRP